MPASDIGRRGFLGASAVSTLALFAGSAADAASNDAKPTDETFKFEITYTEAQWRARLTDAEFRILRRRGTELPRTNPNWNEARAGAYHCKGCDLTIYDSMWKVPLDKGWAFFQQSRPNSVLTGIDGGNPYRQPNGGPGTLIEAHCRRCGSHLGHILKVGDRVLHCIDGTSLRFAPTNA